MPYIRIWRYQVAPGREQDFRAAYGPAGDWARLFRRADGYLGTELIQAAPDSRLYLTIDRWRAAADWDRFLAAHREPYQALDRRLAPLCAQDVEVASFEA
ncbi:MAG TPA: antibiotic biosynthesis monooxygenase [Opitutaceae bacterium]|nr:antibiotic biosynthesis monooxygenase [Opitutaceae bacterium]